MTASAASQAPEQLSLIRLNRKKPVQRSIFLEQLPPDEELGGEEPDKAFIESLDNHGLIQAIGAVKDGDNVIFAFGRRRLKAARRLGWLTIAVWVFPEGTDPKVLALIENQCRSENLGAKLEAIDDLRKKVTEDEICKAVGLPKAQMKQAVYLLDHLNTGLRDALKQGHLSAGTAKKAAKLTPEQQQHLLTLPKITAKDVDVLTRVKAVDQIELLPDSLFEPLPEQSWQQQARPHLEALSKIIPQQEEMFQYVELLLKGLKTLT